MKNKIKKENKLEELERRIKFLEENSISKISMINIPPQEDNRIYFPYYPNTKINFCQFCGKYDCQDTHIIC